MSIGHAETTTEGRTNAMGERKQDLQGKELKQGHFEWAGDLSFTDFATPDDGDPLPIQRFKLALYRDSKHTVATGPYLRIFGMSQAIRSLYDGGGQLQDGGGE